MFPEPSKPAYSVTDTVYAWLSLLLAFLFCQTTPVAEHPLGGFLLIAILFTLGFVIIRLKKQKLYPVCVLCAISALIIGSALLLTDTKFLIKLSFAYSLASYCFFLYAALGNRIEEGFSDYIYIDYIKSLFILPFSSLGAIFPALSNKSTEKGSRFLIKVIIGIGIAIIPTALAFAFLSYDADFMKIIDNIFSFDSKNIGRTMRSLIFALPLAMYGFSLYAASVKKVLHERMTAASCENGLKKAKILPQLTALVAVLPILFLYVVFFISQWQYYVSGFTGVLPENFSYAEYARQGFFELCAVSVINLILIISIAFFIKPGRQSKPVVLKIVTTVFCLCTLILISTAVAKLVMYIRYYGLTPKRIYAMWLMVLIGIVFLLIAFGQYLRRFKSVAICFTVAIVMFSGLAVCNVNALCSQYNADKYLSGELETFDAISLADLGNSAVPALVQVATTMDTQKDPFLKQQIDAVLETRAEEFEKDEFDLFSVSLPALRAKAALKEYFPNKSFNGSLV